VSPKRAGEAAESDGPVVEKRLSWRANEGLTGHVQGLDALRLLGAVTLTTVEDLYGQSCSACERVKEPRTQEFIVSRFRACKSPGDGGGRLDRPSRGSS
jgi:hypothetical protein